MTRCGDFVWTPQRDARLRELYEAGQTWAEIGQAFGISRASAQGHGHRLGLRSRLPVAKAVQRVPGAAEGHVLPHHELIARSTAVRRESGHALPAGNALTWSLVLSSTPVLGDVPWPE
jgi:hypothetical protein